MREPTRVARNTLILTTAMGIARFAALIWVIILARYLHSSVYGIYIFAQTLTGLMPVFSSLGLISILTRDIARNKDITPQYTGNALIVRFIFLCILGFFLVIGITFLNYPFTTKLIIYLLTVSMIFSSTGETLFGVYQGYEDLRYQSFLLVFVRVVTIIVGIIIIFFSLRAGWKAEIILIWIISGQLVVEILTSLLSIFIVTKKFSSISFKFDWEISKYLLKEGVPLGIASAFILIYWHIDAILLFFIKGNVATGIYGVPYRILDNLPILVSPFSVATFPILSRIHQDRERMIVMGRKITQATIILALPLAIMGTFIAGLIPIIFGKDYQASIKVFQILIWTIVFLFPNYILLYILTALGKQKTNMIATIICAVFNIVLNLIFIRLYTYYACSVITLLTELLMMIICLIAIQRYIGRLKLEIPALKILVSGLFMAGCSYLLLLAGKIGVFEWVWLSPLTVIVFIGFLFLLKTFDRQDFRMMKEIYQQQIGSRLSSLFSRF